jgi:hypothetical protein
MSIDCFSLEYLCWLIYESGTFSSNSTSFLCKSKVIVKSCRGYVGVCVCGWGGVVFSLTLSVSVHKLMVAFHFADPCVMH